MAHSNTAKGAHSPLLITLSVPVNSCEVCVGKSKQAQSTTSSFAFAAIHSFPYVRTNILKLFLAMEFS